MSRLARNLSVTAVTAAAVVLASPAAHAAPPTSVPNSAVSGNCIATGSGRLFSQQNDGEKLGHDIRQFAPGGGQAAYIQGQQVLCGGRAR